MDGPDSSYSSWEIHIGWKVGREATIDPPIQTEYLRSGGAMTLSFMDEGTSADNSLCTLSAMPGNMVFPPERMTLPYKSFRTSMSQLLIQLLIVSWRPGVL